ncbi:unnamed protein product [Haemonchus placei]|uniref:FGGY_N domain-containing protein n=1 Tax=Haemonchus placei TaxID=6290 RepID=A0A0N4WKX6_HAEPC|nr:unnamed protein product [Haemonchus placei]
MLPALGELASWFGSCVITGATELTWALYHELELHEGLMKPSFNEQFSVPDKRPACIPAYRALIVPGPTVCPQIVAKTI